MGAAYRVTAPLVIVRDGSGASHHRYAGEVLPADADEKHVQMLLDGEMVEKVDLVEVTDSDDEGADGPPTKSASKGDWEAYARSQGATDEDLDGQTKDDLIAAYGD